MSFVASPVLLRLDAGNAQAFRLQAALPAHCPQVKYDILHVHLNPKLNF